MGSEKQVKKLRRKVLRNQEPSSTASALSSILPDGINICRRRKHLSRPSCRLRRKSLSAIEQLGAQDGATSFLLRVSKTTTTQYHDACHYRRNPFPRHPQCLCCPACPPLSSRSLWTVCERHSQTSCRCIAWAE